MGAQRHGPAGCRHPDRTASGMCEGGPPSGRSRSSRDREIRLARTGARGSATVHRARGWPHDTGSSHYVSRAAGRQRATVRRRGDCRPILLVASSLCRTSLEPGHASSLRVDHGPWIPCCAIKSLAVPSWPTIGWSVPSTTALRRSNRGGLAIGTKVVHDAEQVLPIVLRGLLCGEIIDCNHSDYDVALRVWNWGWLNRRRAAIALYAGHARCRRGSESGT